MAIRLDDSLATVLGTTKYSSRHDTWLWFYLLTKGGAAFDVNEFSGEAMRDRIAECIQQSGITKEMIREEESRVLLPDECLKWITEDPRQLNWLTMKIQGGSIFANTPPPLRLSGRALVIAMIDLNERDISAKKSELQNLERAWVSHKQQDSIFKWFQDGKNGSQRCALAWEWLSKNRYMLTINKVPFEDYNGLLAFFDQPMFGEADKKLFVVDVKKRWSQQQYREKLVGKKQYNFVLSDKAIRHLDRMTEAHGLKRNQILEILIQMEADKGSYIAEKLKTLRALVDA